MTGIIVWKFHNSSDYICNGMMMMMMMMMIFVSEI